MFNMMMQFKLIVLHTIIFVGFINFVCCNVRSKRLASGKKWPLNRIPYSIDGDFARSDRAYIESIIKLFEKTLSVNGKKCLEFEPRNKTAHADYIYFKKSDRCASHIGYQGGMNAIYLAAGGCIRKGTIQHEIMHAIGFDHEQSRHDRDEHIIVNTDNVDDSLQSNFEKNPDSNNHSNQDSPFDYHSILQYNSDALQANKNKLTITSKYPSLLKEEKIQIERDTLSLIDIIQIQRFYNCEQISLDNFKIVNITSMQLVENLYGRFREETSNLKISRDLANKYFKRTIQTCGLYHYWPLDYPIVENNHELYKTVCLKKKGKNEPCKFTEECNIEKGFVCSKVLLKNGVCRFLNSNPIRTFARILESKFNILTKTVSKKFDESWLDFKRIFD